MAMNYFNLHSINDPSERRVLTEKQKEDRKAAEHLGDKRRRIDDILLAREAERGLLEVWDIE